MSTTVPQNIKGQNIMGRHKPTRNSLRHSRMIVTSKHFQGENLRRLLIIMNCVNLKLGNLLLCRSIGFKLSEHPAHLAGEVCVDPQDIYRYQSPNTRRMDLLICKLNTDPTESILEWTHHYCVGSSKSLPSQF